MSALPLIASGVFTISDAGLLLKWLFFASGRLLVAAYAGRANRSDIF
jgi:hypothetical protein